MDVKHHVYLLTHLPRVTESRRDQEEGGELDSPEEFRHFCEIKRRELVLDPQVSPEEIKSREVELGLNVGLFLPQLFPSSGATDIVIVTLFRIAAGTANCCAMPSGHCLNILLFWRRST